MQPQKAHLQDKRGLAMTRAKLMLLEGEAQPHHIELLPDQPISIGRSRDNNVVLPFDEHVSRLHAKIYFEDGQWYVKNFGLNGTRIDDERIQEVAKLDFDAILRIGEVGFRFGLIDGNSSTAKRTTVAAPNKPIPADAQPHTNYGAAISATRLQMDEMSMLCQFIAMSAETPDAHELVRNALQTIQNQTGAFLVGYLSIDPTDPLPKMVIPEQAKVDVGLSRHLTRRVQREGKSVWIHRDEIASGNTGSRVNTESLSNFQDAICVPLRAAGQILGGLHVYHNKAHFEEKEFNFCEALAGYLAHGLHVLKDRRKLEAENSRLRSHSATLDELLGDSDSMQNLRTQITRIAPQSFTVLITGESGVGKELVASGLHKKNIHREKGPFVCVNCAAIAPNLIEAELFGYRRGAFTGADRDHPGYFQQADEGTLFLDEVGELSLEVQAKLLRVLESRTFRPIGAIADVKSDVRIVAATNRNLEVEVRNNKFRADLYYRLNPIQIHVPSLRDHPDDVPILVQAFLERLSIECRRQLHMSPEALEILETFPWPGNVRQLRGFLESLAALAESDSIEPDIVRRFLPGSRIITGDGPPSLNLEELERWAAEKALDQTNNNISQSAQILGISRDTLHNKLKKWRKSDG
jgi:two-component system, NtrC family, response regulator HydG